MFSEGNATPLQQLIKGLHISLQQPLSFFSFGQSWAFLAIWQQACFPFTEAIVMPKLGATDKNRI